MQHANNSLKLHFFDDSLISSATSSSSQVSASVTSAGTATSSYADSSISELTPLPIATSGASAAQTALTTSLASQSQVSPTAAALEQVDEEDVLQMDDLSVERLHPVSSASSSSAALGLDARTRPSLLGDRALAEQASAHLQVRALLPSPSSFASVGSCASLPLRFSPFLPLNVSRPLMRFQSSGLRARATSSS